jgi:hypothetical protein
MNLLLLVLPSFLVAADIVFKATDLPAADIQPLVQAAMDSAPSGSTVRLPAGDWPVGQSLNVPPHTTLRGAGVDQTKLHAIAVNGAFGGPVLGWGGGGRWPNSAGKTRADDVRITDLEVVQTANASANDKCLWGELSDNCVMSRVRVRGSAYEGIVIGSWSKHVTIRDCEAVELRQRRTGVLALDRWLQRHVDVLQDRELSHRRMRPGDRSRRYERLDRRLHD